MKGIFLISVLAIGAVAASPSAQSVFRSSVQYVTVDVVVTDKDDKPIENLTAGDFEIDDNGKPQKVADFKFVSIPVVTRAIDTVAAAQPQPDVTSNLPATPDSRLFALVIDDLHLLEKDIIKIKRVLKDFLQSISPDDEVAMVFVSRSDLGLNFTRDTGRLLAAVDNLRAAMGFGFDSLATAAPVPPNQAYVAARTSASTLRNVAKSMGGSRHPRRAILWVSDGDTVDTFGSTKEPEMMMFAEYQDILRDAARSDVPIYSISPRASAMPEDAIRGAQIGDPQTRATVLRNMRIQRNNLTVVANLSGGRAIVDASDMPRMMREIVQENGSYYLLGYYPDPFEANGKFHELKVKVKRDGARVRARPGYDAPGAERASGFLVSATDTAISAGVNVSALPLRAFAQPMASNGKNLTVAVSIELTYPAPADASRRIDDRLQLKIVALDPDAKVKASMQRSHRFTVAAPAAGDITFLVNEVIEVPAQFLTLRIAIASDALGKAGSVQVPIEMPKGPKSLTLGGIAVGFDGAPREAVMVPEAFKDLIPFQPVTTRVFSQGDVLRLFGHVYWKDKSQPSVTMTLKGGPRGVVTVTPQLIAQKPAGDQQDAVIALMLPIQGMSPGKYHLALAATLPGGKPVSRDVLFEVK